MPGSRATLAVLLCALGGAPVGSAAAPRDPPPRPAQRGTLAPRPSLSASAAPRAHRAGAPAQQRPRAARRALRAREDAARARVVAAARRHLGGRPERDCSAFVQRVFRDAGVPLALLGPAASASEGLWRATRVVNSPRPGDLAFFHDTYDRDRDGRPGDRFTHVAIVERADGRAVTLIHRGSKGIARVRMDLGRPGDPARNGALRQRRRDDPAATRYLAGELFAGFGAPSALGAEPAQVSATRAR